MIKGLLFSEYFIEAGIKNTDDYKRLSITETKRIYKAIKQLYHLFTERQSPDEANTGSKMVGFDIR